MFEIEEGNFYHAPKMRNVAFFFDSEMSISAS